jgi:uncharacterized protein
LQSIAVDAGPLIALFSRRDIYHLTALDFFRKTEANFVTNVAAVAELAHLLSFSAAAVRDALGWINAAFEIDNETDTDLPRIIAIMEKYADLPADFTDASLVALCERRAIEAIATLDSDFEVYQLANGARLRNAMLNPEGN